MIRIKFSYNWNAKLGASYFTTIRKWSQEKERYYRSIIGEKVEIVLKDKHHSFAVLRGVSHGFEFSRASNQVLRSDTGYYDLDDIRRIFANFGVGPADKIMVLEFTGVTG